MPTPSTGDAELLAFVPSVVATGYDPVALVDAVFALNRIYFFFEDGRENIQVYDGSVLKEASGVAPSAVPTVTGQAPSGAGDTGQRWYTYALLDPGNSVDEEVETGPAANESSVSADLYGGVALVAQDATFDIPNPPAGSRFTKARVYRNLKPLTDMYALEDVTITPGAGGSVTFVDDFTVDDDELATHARLNLAKRFYSEGLPPASPTGMFFEGRMFIVNPAQPNQGQASTANRPQDFPTEDEVGASLLFYVLPSQEDPQPTIKKMCPNNGQKYIYTRRGIYHLFGSQPPFGVRCVVAGIGADSTYSTHYVEGVGVIFCSQDKAYVHLGGSDVRPLGVQRSFPDRNPLGDLYDGTDEGRRKHSDLLVLPVESSALLSMGINGQAVNQRNFLWNYSTNDWSVWTRAIMRMGFWALPTGRYLPVFADELGDINQMNVGDSEGAYAGDLSAVVTSATRSAVLFNVLLKTMTPARGVPLYILDTDGGVLYRNRFLSQGVAGTLSVLHPWTTLPVIGQTIETGSIEFVYESGFFTLFPDRTQAEIARITGQLVVQAGGTLRLLYGSDQDDDLVLVDGAVPLDIVQFLRSAKDRGSVFKVRMENTAPGSPVGIVSFQMDFTKKSHRV